MPSHALPESRRSAVNTASVIETLDSLDTVLLAAIVEVESLADAAVSASDLEAKLAEIWRKSYAYHASQQEAELGSGFVLRGWTLSNRILLRSRGTQTPLPSGLPPRFGDQLLKLYPSAREHLLQGADYASRDADGRFEFIRFTPLPKRRGGPDGRTHCDGGWILAGQ